MNANIFENGNVRTIDVPAQLSRAGAAFHPTNPDRLYLFGGKRENSDSQAALAYHFEDNTFHEMSTLMPYYTFAPACESYIKSNGHAVSTFYYGCLFFEPFFHTSLPYFLVLSGHLGGEKESSIDYKGLMRWWFFPNSKAKIKCSYE